MSKLNKFQKFSLISCFLPIIAFLISYLSRNYRYSEMKIIYQVGVTLVYFLWLSSFLIGFINSLFIWTTKSMKLKTRIFWIIVSLLPILYIVIMLLSIFNIDYYFNDDIILPNGERIDSYYRNNY